MENNDNWLLINALLDNYEEPLDVLSSTQIPPKSKFFGIYLLEISTYSATSKKTDETVQMVCKVDSIFDEIFKI